MPMPSELPTDVPFILACIQCDADSPEDYDASIQAGWVQIQYDDGPG